MTNKKLIGWGLTTMIASPLLGWLIGILSGIVIGPWGGMGVMVFLFGITFFTGLFMLLIGIFRKQGTNTNKKGPLYQKESHLRAPAKKELIPWGVVTMVFFAPLLSWTMGHVIGTIIGPWQNSVISTILFVPFFLFGLFMLLWGMFRNEETERNVC